MSSLLLDALDMCGIKYTFKSGVKIYKSGLLNKEIETILANANKVGEIVREEVGQEKYVKTLPFFPVCSNCGRIYTTRSYEFMPEERKVMYKCEGMEVKGQWLAGCGYKGEANYKKGEGKLSWKSEFAARWKALEIRFEPYGKDIADSVKINDRISLEILNYAPPMHSQYEMFLDKSGRKISKSTGNVFTPQVWFRYGSPQSLLLLMLKRFIGTRSLSIMDIPQYMKEFDDLEDIFFSKRVISDEKERAKLRGLYEYCNLLKPPSKPTNHVPYNLLTYLAKVAPTGAETDFIIEKLRNYSYIKGEPPENMLEKIAYAQNWNQDLNEIRQTDVELRKKEKQAIEELIKILKTEKKKDKIQSAIFQIARKNNIRPSNFFKTLYTILLGVTEGPKLGPYIISMGNKNVVEALKKAKNEGKNLLNLLEVTPLYNKGKNNVNNRD